MKGRLCLVRGLREQEQDINKKSLLACNGNHFSSYLLMNKLADIVSFQQESFSVLAAVAEES